VRLTPTKDIPAADYTLPRLWRQLKDGCRYEQRVAAAAAFNAASPWLKRGLGMTHTRFDTSTLSKAALVSIYPDGSVILFCGGTELGQGLTTKVKQARGTGGRSAAP
jgi:xanthine dehydrogenase molybdopterin-binding subunit B